MADKFRLGDGVRVKKSRHMLTGKIVTVQNLQGRHLVRYDEEANDTSVLQEGLHYEDELEPCQPPTIRA
jgi:hypothetical protein